MATDFQNQKIEIEDTLLTTTKFGTINSILKNIDTLKEGHNNLTQAVEDELNKLQEVFEAAELADSVDIDKINETLIAVQALMSEAEDGANFVSAIGAIHIELNRRLETISLEKVITSETGVAEIDLSSFNFSSIDDYSLLVTYYGRKPVIVSVEKIDETKCNIVVEDMRMWEESDESIRLRDCSAEGEEISVNLVLMRNAIPLVTTFHEVDGDDTTV